MDYPEWVLRQKIKGTEIRKIGSNYYLYKIRSEWDKDKKRPKKITEKFLGTITEEGLRKPKAERLIEAQKNICVKEFGASQFIKTELNDIIQNLKEIFPDIWKEIFTFAVFRFFSASPLKNIQFHYSQSCYFHPNKIGKYFDKRPFDAVDRAAIPSATAEINSSLIRIISL